MVFTEKVSIRWNIPQVKSRVVYRRMSVSLRETRESNKTKTSATVFDWESIYTAAVRNTGAAAAGLLPFLTLLLGHPQRETTLPPHFLRRKITPRITTGELSNSLSSYRLLFKLKSANLNKSAFYNSLQFSGFYLEGKAWGRVTELLAIPVTKETETSQKPKVTLEAFQRCLGWF